MRCARTAAILILTVAAWAVPSVVAGQEFKVVINEANSTTVIDRDGLSKCFMKQASKWISGHTVVPVDQAPSSEIRKVFSTKIHGRDVSKIQKYWQRQIYSGRGVPPQELSSDKEVLAFVRSNPGAVGYVSAGAKIGDGVKVLEITGE